MRNLQKGKKKHILKLNLTIGYELCLPRQYRIFNNFKEENCMPAPRERYNTVFLERKFTIYVFNHDLTVVYFGIFWLIAEAHEYICQQQGL